MIESLTDRIAQAIGDPGSVLARGAEESVTRWSTRAVESVLGYTSPPDGLDARFAKLAITVHCSHCGNPYEGDEGPMWFTPEQVHKLGDYELVEGGWIVNLDGLHDSEVDDHKLVCRECAEAGWCEFCDEPIRAWQHVVNTTEVGVVHEKCTKTEADRKAEHAWRERWNWRGEPATQQEETK
jgi:hypothetical protein